MERRRSDGFLSKILLYHILCKQTRKAVILVKYDVKSLTARRAKVNKQLNYAISLQSTNRNTYMSTVLEASCCSRTSSVKEFR